MKKRVKHENYLDLVPVHREQQKAETDDNGKVTIYVENKGLFNRIAQIFFRRPAVSQIHLDEMGNFIWPLLDGKRTVYEIAALVREAFGDAAEPLYNRLVTYLRTMEQYGFIRMESPYDVTERGKI